MKEQALVRKLVLDYITTRINLIKTLNPDIESERKKIIKATRECRKLGTELKGTSFIIIEAYETVELAVDKVVLDLQRLKEFYN